MFLKKKKKELVDQDCLVWISTEKNSKKGFDMGVCCVSLGFQNRKEDGV